MNNLFNTVTIEQFKAKFPNDFPYFPLYNGTKTYYEGDIVYMCNDDFFYRSTVDFNTSIPGQSETWVKTKANTSDYITDEDILKAMAQAKISGNEKFGSDTDEKIFIYLHLVAFYLVMDWKNSHAGVTSAYAGFTASKSVGDVSESYNFPTWLMNSPLFSLYSTNGFGLKYLSLILPYLSCTILYSDGRSTFN